MIVVTVVDRLGLHEKIQLPSHKKLGFTYRSLPFVIPDYGPGLHDT